MLLTVGTGAVLLVELVVLIDDVAEHAVTDVVLVVLLGPPTGGFLMMQSVLLHLLPEQTLPQYVLID